MLIDKLIQRVIHRSSPYHLSGWINLHDNLTFFQDDRHDTLIVHIKTCHAYGVKQSREMELPMDDLTGVYILEFVILDSLEIEFVAIQCRHRGRTLHVISAGT